MAKWIGEVQQTDRDNSDMPVSADDSVHGGKWKPVMLAVLFAVCSCADSGLA